MVWNKILKFLGRSQIPRVMVSGLKNENRFFKESVVSEAEMFLSKASKVMDSVDGVHVHVKSSGKGKTSKFEIHGLLSARGADFHAQANGRELNFVLKDLFDELLKEARKKKGVRDKGKKHRERFMMEVESE